MEDQVMNLKRHDYYDLNDNKTKISIQRFRYLTHSGTPSIERKINKNI